MPLFVSSLNYGELDAGCFLLNGDWVEWFPSVGETLFSTCCCTMQPQ